MSPSESILPENAIFCVAIQCLKTNTKIEYNILIKAVQMSEKKIDLILSKLEVINTEISGLKEGQVSLKEGQARLEEKVGSLELGQNKLEQGQNKLEQGQSKLEQGQSKLEQGQMRLEEKVESLERSLVRLDDEFHSFKHENAALHKYTQLQINQTFEKLSVVVDHEVRIRAVEHKMGLRNGK